LFKTKYLIVCIYYFNTTKYIRQFEKNVIRGAYENSLNLQAIFLYPDYIFELNWKQVFVDKVFNI
jgi:hypothetical protein